MHLSVWQIEFQNNKIAMLEAIEQDRLVEALSKILENSVAVFPSIKNVFWFLAFSHAVYGAENEHLLPECGFAGPTIQGRVLAVASIQIRLLVVGE